MIFDDFKQLVERFKFKQNEQLRKENENLSRQIYNTLLSEFPTFKLVSFQRNDDGKIVCLGEFLGRKKKHLVQFVGKLENNEFQVDKELIKKALQEEEEAMSKVVSEEIMSLTFEIVDRIHSLAREARQHLGMLKDIEMTDIFDFLKSSYSTSTLGIVQYLLSTRLDKRQLMNFLLEQLKFLGKDFDVNEIISCLERLKNFKAWEYFAEKFKGPKYFTLTVPFKLLTEEGERDVNASVIYKDLDDLDSMIIEFYDDNMKLLEELDEYAFDKKVKAEIAEIIKKKGSSSMSVPLAYTPMQIRINKAFLPSSLEIGDVIEVDGMKLKLVSKGENLISEDLDKSGGSYWIFTPLLSSDSESEIVRKIDY